MQGNRRRDTRAELAIRRAAHARGLRYRVDTRPIASVPTTADLVFTRSRVAVFVDGCWWHGCSQHYRPPASNSDYWSAKVRRNRVRDHNTDRLLRACGWYVLRIWEHESVESAVERIVQAVHGDQATKDESL